VKGRLDGNLRITGGVYSFLSETDVKPQIIALGNGVANSEDVQEPRLLVSRLLVKVEKNGAPNQGSFGCSGKRLCTVFRKGKWRYTLDRGRYRELPAGLRCDGPSVFPIILLPGSCFSTVLVQQTE
jgi:hypothetical protein